MHYSFRWFGLAVLLIAAYCRMHARMILPNGYGYSGDFWSSEWGVWLSGFADICNVLMFLGGLAYLMSFTLLLGEPSAIEKKNKDWGKKQVQPPV